LISQENKGHGGALNTGCAAACGKYLKVIDADDWVVSENLSEFIAALEQCSSDVVLTHHHTIDISTGEIKNWRSYPKEFWKGYTFQDIMADWRSFDRSLTFHGITYRTEFYHQFGHQLLEHVFYEDHEYATYPCCYAETVTPFDLFLYEYRIGDVNQSVSNANQLKRLGHTETVLQRMAEKYQTLEENGGKQYAAMKIQGLLLSYLTTALLVNPDKKGGRQMSKVQMKMRLSDVPEAYVLAKRKYRIFCLLNRLHISKSVWDAILTSSLYNRLRKNHSFD
jgi:glycosyltransferase involved in cell wall biosynthesis